MRNQLASHVVMFAAPWSVFGVFGTFRENFRVGEASEARRGGQAN